MQTTESLLRTAVFNLIKIEVDGIKASVVPGTSVLEATKLLGIKVPRFCYYQGLSISGNCRMCLVEFKNVEKLVLSCSTRVEPNVEIITNSFDVKKARENVLELLLINHPLDCPICDQGGECDLQENTLSFGSFSSKINKVRRGVQDTSFNFLIKNVMTRCIHCTRCIRFADEIAYSPVLGTLNRGDSTEIGSYSTKSFNSEISGNVIDLCPVGSIINFKKNYCGALTNRRESFKTRPWEFKALETIDLTDSICSTLLVNTNEIQVLRVLPKSNTLDYNLISNKARFSYDSLKNNRLYTILAPQKTYFKNKIWKEVLKQLSSFIILNKNLIVVTNQNLNLIALNKLKFLSYLQKNIKIVNLISFNTFDNVYYYYYNSFTNFSNKTRNFYLIGLNLNSEIPTLSAKIKFILSSINSNLYMLGNKSFFSSLAQSFSLNIIDFLKIYEGKKKVFSYLLPKLSSQTFIGESCLTRCNSSSLFFCFSNKNDHDLIICYTHSNCEFSNLINLKSGTQKDFMFGSLIFFIDINDSVLIRKLLKSIQTTKIWFSSHINMIYRQSFLMIPTTSNYFEQFSLHINIEKVPRVSKKILNAITASKSILNIINFYLPIVNKSFNCFSFINEKVKKSKFLSIKFLELFGYKKLLPQSQPMTVSKYTLKINQKTSLDVFQKNSYNWNTFLLRQRIE